VQHNTADGEQELSKTYLKSAWSSDQPLCPITGYTLENADAGITMTQDTDEVVVTFASDYTATEHIGSHGYTVRATAAGGADADTTTDFLTYHWCYAEAAAAQTLTFGPYDIPDVPEDHEHIYFPDDYSAWLAPPKVGCAYEFEF
jgi:hypothetical protein